MRGSGSGIFLEPDDYRLQLPGTRDFLLLEPQQFQARLTWVSLPRLHLLRAQEPGSRVRYVVLPPDRAFVTFPMHRGSTLICGGTEVHSPDFIFHGSAERFHERTVAASRWGSVSIRVEALSLFARTLTGSDLAPPPSGCVIHPKAVDRLELVRLHAQAARMAETKPDMLGHPEVSRALEEELIRTLLTCLTSGGYPGVKPVQVHEPLMVRLEEALAAYPDHMPGVAEICDAIGISGSSLQSCCLRVLGMTPARYLYLRRLTLVQALLMQATFVTISASDLPRQHGFADFHHFVMEYQRAFGSVPAQF
jgi:AraC-like DNA-binding protein